MKKKKTIMMMTPTTTCLLKTCSMDYKNELQTVSSENSVLQDEKVFIRAMKCTYIDFFMESADVRYFTHGFHKMNERGFASNVSITLFRALWFVVKTSLLSHVFH